MTAQILSGRPIADTIKAEVAAEAAALESGYGFRPCLVAVRVGEDAASQVYVGNKIKAAAETGIRSEHLHLSAGTETDELLALVQDLNAREDVDGILVQLPLPAHVDEQLIINTINPEKDVDGFHPVNVGKLSLGHPSLVPCTPAGVVEILKRSNIGISGKHAVIVGRSNIVGKPLALLLLRENATITICHSRTTHLTAITSQADILVAAVGQAGFIRDDHVKPGATVIDVGINKVDRDDFARELFEGEELDKRLNAISTRGFTLVGDVNPKEAILKADFFTPVPGGVGLLTVAMLMKNTVQAAKLRRGV
jgi:methylenetetrahydrofolate dehydrogenase (NADP+)/methenyltetrahydrofolate cyclohydrolase